MMSAISTERSARILLFLDPEPNDVLDDRDAVHCLTPEDAYRVLEQHRLMRGNSAITCFEMIEVGRHGERRILDHKRHYPLVKAGQKPQA
jgi:hypothetical protein